MDFRLHTAACCGSLNGEDKAKMTRKPNVGSREQLTPGELADLRRRLAAMATYELEIFYKAAHNACRYEAAGRVPCPRVIQEMVQAWKLLRRGKKS
jgi:hypothetical protein